MLHTRLADLNGFLFGDILAVGWQDVWKAAALCGLVTAGVFSRLSELSLLTAHEELARVCGVRARRLNYISVIVLALTQLI